MSRAERDPERGGVAAAKLKALGAKPILIKAAEQGYITQVACKMPECFCPEELGGACYFEPVTHELSDWMPTVEHFPIPKREGGREVVDNVILAHRLCNRIDYSLCVGRSHESDLERIRKAREEAIRGNVLSQHPKDVQSARRRVDGEIRTTSIICADWSKTPGNRRAWLASPRERVFRRLSAKRWTVTTLVEQARREGRTLVAIDADRRTGFIPCRRSRRLRREAERDLYRVARDGD
jgi:hypothetical protein